MSGAPRTDLHPPGHPVTELLHNCRRFGREASRQKELLLQQIHADGIHGPAQLRHLHDALLYLLAYPDNVRILRLAEHLLRLLEPLSDLWYQEGKPAKLRLLTGSGLSGTELQVGVSYALAAEMLRIGKGDVGLHSLAVEGQTVSDLLRLLFPAAEIDAVLADSGDLHAWWLDQCGQDASQALGQLLDRIARLTPDPLLRESLFQRLKPFLYFKLGNALPAVSRVRLKGAPNQYIREKLRKEVDIQTIWREGRPARVRLGRREQEELLLTARLALLMHYKEIDPVTYGHVGDLELYDMGRGLQIALFGLLPNHRLPYDTYLGFMAFRNGVPVCYGGAWCQGYNAQIGLNILEAFRGGESAWLFCQLVRLYSQVHGVRQFRIDPFQLGKGNKDGWKSGVYWFYYRMGFRPEKAELLPLAEAEWLKFKRDPRHQPGPAVMRRLTGDYLYLNLEGRQLQVLPLHVLPVFVNERIRDHFRGDRSLAIRTSTRELCRHLAISKAQLEAWTEVQRYWLDQFALWLPALGTLGAWTRKEKKDLLALILAKAGKGEGEFHRRWHRHARLQRALMDWPVL